VKRALDRPSEIDSQDQTKSVDAIDAVWALALAGAAFGAYLATLTPGLAYEGGDGPELTVVASTLGLAHPTGYPLYTWLGWLATHVVPLGSLAWRMNLLSATLGAAGVGMIYLVARRLPMHPVPAALAAAAYGVSTTFWGQAVITEVYAPNVFALGGTLWLALRWADGVARDPVPARDDRRFAFFALAYGASFGMHLSNLGFAPAYAAFALLIDPGILRRPWSVARAVLAFLLGVAQFAWLPLRAGFNDTFPNSAPQDWTGLYRYTVGTFATEREALPIGNVPAQFARYVALVVDNFGVAGLVLGLAGMARLARVAPRRFWLLFLMWAMAVGAFMRTFLLDVDVFFVASNVVVALFVGAGLDAVRAGIVAATGRSRRAARALSTAAAVAAIVVLAGAGRASWRANDRSTDTALGDFYAAAFEMVPPQSVLVPAGRGAFGSAAIYWRLAHGGRADFVLASDRGLPPPVDRPLTFFAQTTAPPGLERPWSPRAAAFTHVLRGARRDLVLYRLERDTVPEPWPPPDRMPGAGTLVGGSITPVKSVRPARVHVRALWKVVGEMPIVTTRIGDVTVEAHRCAGAVIATQPASRVVQEDYDLIVPSQLPNGSHPVALGAIDYQDGRIAVRWAPAGDAVIE